MSSSNKAVIIVAGGKGTRMGGEVAKQYLPIGGKPVVMQTIDLFYRFDAQLDLILVIPEGDFDYWNHLCIQYNFIIPHKVITGGNSRFQSVRNGLDSLPYQQGLVVIHDAVRPFVNTDVIANGFEVAEKSGSAIAVIACKDSIRKLSDDGKSVAQERQHFRLVQTPQTFQLAKIKKAFEVTELQQFTDDATVYENQGWQVTLIAGNPENIKITTPEDLNYAEYLLAQS